MTPTAVRPDVAVRAAELADRMEALAERVDADGRGELDAFLDRVAMTLAVVARRAHTAMRAGCRRASQRVRPRARARRTRRTTRSSAASGDSPPGEPGPHRGRAGA